MGGGKSADSKWGEFLMAITDLTGTKWALKASLISYPGGTYTLKSYSVNITSDEATEGLNAMNTPTDTFALFAIGYSGGAEMNEIYMKTASDDAYIWAAGNDTKSLPDTWSAVLAIPFMITGGSDATNSDLIAWLEDNADPVVQRVEYLTDNIELASIADAIRTKGGTSASLTFPAGFVSAIQAISGGGGAVTHVSSTFNGGYCRYVDANGVYHSVLPEPGEPGSPTISEDMISGSMFIVETGSTRGLSFTNATQVEISDHTSSAYLRYTVIFQVD